MMNYKITSVGIMGSVLSRGRDFSLLYMTDPGPTYPIYWVLKDLSKGYGSWDMLTDYFYLLPRLRICVYTTTPVCFFMTQYLVKYKESCRLTLSKKQNINICECNKLLE
jgi:hypothetical protein